MAFEAQQLTFGNYIAAANLSSGSHPWRAVTWSTSVTNGFKLTTGTGQRCIGILQDNPTSGRAGSIATFGVTKARVLSTAHTAINRGDRIVAAANGGVRASTGTTVAHNCIGRALDSLAANTVGIITILLTQAGSGTTGAQSV